ncbi:hypothetical protein [Endozoicomonas lisbonensis]|uniref:Uncharacterized protein n=1 Tax=Endozoicomonas lisbonensis TaxID=3120522 RepID=A0ABV2SKY4_9GAMM
MLKTLNSIKKRFPDLGGQPLVHFYQQALVNTRSTVLQELLKQLFEVNQWELPEPFQEKKVRETLDDV